MSFLRTGEVDATGFEHVPIEARPGGMLNLPRTARGVAGGVLATSALVLGFGLWRVFR